jgi:hypothetical protein
MILVIYIPGLALYKFVLKTNTSQLICLSLIQHGSYSAEGTLN